MSDLVTVILAAGKGTRMKSKLPKVLHRVGGKSMLQHVLDAAKQAGAKRNIVVVGFGGETVKEAMGDQAEFVVQKEQLGTGHAVQQTAPLLAEYASRGILLQVSGLGSVEEITTSILEKLREAGLA